MSNKQEILKILIRELPDTGPTLNFNNTFELLLAVILSAQCTDKQVNKTTANLFSKYQTPEDFACLAPEQLEQEIKGCGLYRNKSLHIIKTSRILVEKYGGKVPDNLLALQSLPGVGRKTANVVLNIAYQKPTFPVDTHVFRVSRRLGLSGGNTSFQVEKDLIKLIPEQERGSWHHRLIQFGRTICTSRGPKCDHCPVEKFCKYQQGKKVDREK
ncbi:DNA-(apurinic or apyrimidinic site) lyase /endonuclease III [Desulfotomaculum arcticum]|uniref:Endonuclease III n=1 Tax=Desulfotruncus arcticus DSM 17038 TaxID=1121424 RepID=A0A1I2MZX7_9FIRM|nr:endonuclease III [Desulfotruncus arcticus]SFF97144.1 DNA-(apurinic or apyrimidinic site) lyase /endonuclease III [Desulfotomaculum arcticum] [Desulfotruncus arcticus DSM 17038]